MADFQETILCLPQNRDTGLLAPSLTSTLVLELGPETQHLLAGIERQLSRIADAVGRQGGTGLGSPKATYSVKEAAQMLGRSESTIRRWIREGELESTKSAASQQGRHMIPYGSLRKYLGSG